MSRIRLRRIPVPGQAHHCIPTRLFGSEGIHVHPGHFESRRGHPLLTPLERRVDEADENPCRPFGPVLEHQDLDQGVLATGAIRPRRSQWVGLGLGCGVRSHGARVGLPADNTFRSKHRTSHPQDMMSIEGEAEAMGRMHLSDLEERCDWRGSSGSPDEPRTEWTPRERGGRPLAALSSPVTAQQRNGSLVMHWLLRCRHLHRRAKTADREVSDTPGGAPGYGLSPDYPTAGHRTNRFQSW